LENTTKEMRNIAEQIQKLQARMHELDSIFQKNGPQAKQLETEVKSLTEMEDQIARTLHPLKEKREKMFTIFKGVWSSLSSGNK
jgi:peptidoglycan hydrolase CwlO-like protein